ncbi:MAG: transglutaminase domain-containing protein [Eubacteriales bacterium]|nr:transglutaminase domain-containing protein [Eubacteriales bacterium]
MKEKKKLIALIISAVMWITSVSPAFAAEFSSGGEDISVFMQEASSSDEKENESGDTDLPGDDAVFSEGTQEEISPKEDTREENPPEEMLPEELFPEEGSPEAAGAGEASDTEIFSDTEDILTSGEEEAQTEEFADGEYEDLFQSTDGKQVVCTIAPIKRVDEFTPIGTGCDTPSAEEVVMEAGPELFTAGSESEDVDEADLNAVIKASDDLRAAMVKRKGTVDISLHLSFEVDEESWDYLVYSLLLMAFEETGNPWEGDYLRWHFQETELGLITKDEKTMTYTIHLPFVFYTTYAQEQKVTSEVNRVLASLKITEKTTPYMRIKKIYDYICRTVAYDEAHVRNSSYTRQFTAYAALIDKTAVCQGYALLMYRMLMEVGIENRMVPSENHIWNLVYLRGAFYNTDATWDAGVIPEYYKYFLKGSRSFEADKEHIRESDDIFCDYNSAEFKNEYPTSVTDYTVQAADIPSGGECTHSWGAWKTILKPDCTSEGLKYKECTKCGEENYAAVPKTAHKWKYSSKKNNTHTAKCSVCGTSKVLKCSFQKNICSKCKAQRIPAAVKITKISSAGYNKLKLTWKKVEGATGYEISYLKGKTWKVIQKTSGTTFTQTSSKEYPIKTGSTCYYRVRAYCTVNGKTTYGAYSAKTGGKAVAARPVLVSVKAKSYNQVTIKWQKAAGATHYLIYRKNGTKWERVATIAGADVTSYTHTSSQTYPVEVGTAYVYTVRSYTKTGNTYGLYDTAGKSVKTSLGKTTLTVSKTGTGLKNTWTRVKGATGYQLQRYSGGKWSVVKTVNSGTLSHIDTSAEKGASYQYRVRAYRVFSGKRVYGGYSSVKTAKR